MSVHLILPIVLFLNALLHIIQGFLYGFNQKTTPVVIWGVVLAVLSYLWLNPVATWIKWTTLIMPIVGGIVLSSQLKKSTNAKWIDIGILLLDGFTIGFLAYVMFL